MRASLDINVELNNHGKDVLEKVDADIASGKIEIYCDILWVWLMKKKQLRTLTQSIMLQI